MSEPKGTRYSLTLPPPLESDLEHVAKSLHTTKSEALRRALMLMKHAVSAESVELTDEHGAKQMVLIK